MPTCEGKPLLKRPKGESASVISRASTRTKLRNCGPVGCMTRTDVPGGRRRWRREKILSIDLQDGIGCGVHARCIQGGAVNGIVQRFVVYETFSSHHHMHGQFRPFLFAIQPIAAGNCGIGLLCAWPWLTLQIEIPFHNLGAKQFAIAVG